MNLRTTLRPVLLLAAAAAAGTGTLGCSSGAEYETGFVSRESSFIVPFHFGRNAERVHWSLLAEPVVASGATWAGNQYVNLLNGALLTVNVPGIAMILFYPFQASDVPEARYETFGIGSGEGDFRLSALWGLLSLGRNWNFLFLNGFWWGDGDPLFVEAPPEVVEELEEITIGVEDELEDELEEGGEAGDV
ncbi:MAG: hypothetical protein ACF8XB_21005 [Planctomycetota bacterium JB042]